MTFNGVGPSRPRVLMVPHFRTMGEIFRDATLESLRDEFEVVWGRDEPMPAAQFVDELSRADAAVFAEWTSAVDLSNMAPSLRVLLDVSGTLDHPGLDYWSCFERGIDVGSIAPVFARPVAEHCLGLAISAARNVVDSDRRFASVTEQYQHDGTVGCTSLYGNTVGFVGCGGISRALQHLLEPFGCTFLGYDPWMADEAFVSRGIVRCREPESLFERAGVIFVLAVPTQENEGLVSRELMALLDPTDVLVVASRAHLVDFEALTELVLDDKFRAAVDVFPTEPLDRTHRIRNARSAVLTAHIAGALPDDLLLIGDSVLDDLRSVFSGERPRRLQYATREMIAGLWANS